jgi:hypothetical protein
MRPEFHRVLFATPRTRSSQGVDVAVVAGAFVVTFLAYATDVFAVSGGAVFLAEQAALVGIAAAAVLGYRRAGLAPAWLGVYAALLGHSADHYLLGLSYAAPTARLRAFLQLDGLVFLAVQALVLGTLAWGVGRLVGAGELVTSFLLYCGYETVISVSVCRLCARRTVGEYPCVVREIVYARNHHSVECHHVSSSVSGAH